MTFSAVIFDVDDVMLDMDRIAEVAVDAIGLGDDVKHTFSTCYSVLIDRLRSVDNPDYPRLEADIRRWQRTLETPKIFSRHVLIAIALERCGRKVTRDAVHGGADRYWQKLADETELFDDARAALDRLRAEGTPFSLATNSDGFLELDEGEQTFRYDPEDAVRRKLARLDALREAAVEDGQITVGDPHGKPDPRFYERVFADFERFHGAPPDLSRALAVGDSLTSDVLPFLDAGVPRGAWLARRSTSQTDRKDVVVIRALTELWTARWPD